MPKGYLKNPRVPIAEAAKKETANRKKRQPPQISTETPQISTETHSESNITTSTENANKGQITRSGGDLLLNAQIAAPTVKDAAAEEGLTTTNAYAAKRIGDFSRQDVLKKTLLIKQTARKRGYKLDELVHAPERLQAALDDYDLTCFELGLYPLQDLLAVWLSTTVHQITALQSAANVSEAGAMIAQHSAYCVSVISSAAMLSDKPPLFSIYYLKTAYKMFDQDNGQIRGNLSVISGNGINISISAGEIAKKTEIFAEIDAESGEAPPAGAALGTSANDEKQND